MFKPSANKILLAASALLLGAGLGQAQAPSPSPLTASPSSVSISYSGAPGADVPVVLTIPSGSDAFVIDPTTVPLWLNTNISSGSAVPTPGQTVDFVASSAAGALPPGAYTANVGVAVNGYAELIIPVTITVSGAASTLSVMNGSTPVVSGGAVVSTPWTYGAAAPTLSLTLLSSDDPIAFTAVSAPTVASTENWIQLSVASGIAYNYGTGLTITFAKDALINSKVGATLAGTVTISYQGTTFVVNVNVVIGEPLPTVTKVFPQETPALGAGSALTVVVTGSGFGTTAQGYTSATQVLVTYGAAGAHGPTDLTTILSADSVQGAVNVVNSTTMILTIPWEDSAAVSILHTAGQNVTLGITNNLTGETVPVPVTIYVTSNPIIYSITDAAALEEPAPGTPPSVAPYELISIFGNNFCPTCSAPVIGTVTSSRYPTSITAGGSPLTVTFNTSAGVSIAEAYLLFVTNTQINALVPSTVTAADTNMKVVVSYNSLPSNDNVPYLANGAATHPGIFTLSSTGQGQGAIELASGVVNSSASTSTKAALSGASASILIYASGLGVPNSVAKDLAASSAAKFPGSCVSLTGTSSYIDVADLTNPATADGAVLNPTDILTNLLPPCFTTSPVVTIGGAAAAVTYAGWVSGSVAGLYQINATVPAHATTGNAVPVTVTMGGVSSQAGVTMAIQ